MERGNCVLEWAVLGSRLARCGISWFDEVGSVPDSSGRGHRVADIAEYSPRCNLSDIPGEVPSRIIAQVAHGGMAPEASFRLMSLLLSGRIQVL